jgi:hypothetical protein
VSVLLLVGDGGGRERWSGGRKLVKEGEVTSNEVEIISTF